MRKVVLLIITPWLLSSFASANDGLCANLFESRCSIVNACSTPMIMDYVGEAVRANEVEIGKKIDAINADTLLRLKEEPLPRVSANQKAALSSVEINKLYRKVAQNNVASYSKIAKYDPKGGIGFCFGRAMTAHLEALWGFSLAQSSIRKIWAIGNLESGNTMWGHHVTTAVRGINGSWWTIDPNFGGPITVEQWYSKMRNQYDVKKTMVIFQTEAKRFGPSVETGYRKNELNDEFYNGFFVDLLNDFKRRRSKNDI